MPATELISGFAGLILHRCRDIPGHRVSSDLPGNEQQPANLHRLAVRSDRPWSFFCEDDGLLSAACIRMGFGIS
jgi:hypothetical protein